MPEPPVSSSWCQVHPLGIETSASSIQGKIPSVVWQENAGPWQRHPMSDGDTQETEGNMLHWAVGTVSVNIAPGLTKNFEGCKNWLTVLGD